MEMCFIFLFLSVLESQGRETEGKGGARGWASPIIKTNKGTWSNLSRPVTRQKQKTGRTEKPGRT